MQFFRELRRRQVVQVGIAYLVVAWGVAQVADLVLDNYDAPGWIMQVILAVLGVGFPVAVILSWVFDLRWDGLQRESDLAAGKAAPVLPAQKVEHNSIAVLPFADMSPDKDQEYFSDGISEELLNLLSKIPQLRVAARTSAFSFKGKDTEIPEIARRLNVAHVLEGSVRKAGNKIRITAQLIQAENGYHLWSETWDRSLEDIFAVQDEIATEVVAQLKLTLLAPVPTMEETNPEAYALYLQARHLGRQSSTEGYNQSDALFEQALALAPDYAAAWEGLAYNYNRQAAIGLQPLENGLRLAHEAAEKALALDPDYAHTHATLGLIAFVERDFAAAARHFQKALVLAPGHPDILRSATLLTTALGRLDNAIRVLEYVAVRDPVNPMVHANLGISYYYARRFDSAIACCRTALRLAPGRMITHAIISSSLLLQGDARGALAEAELEPNESFRLTSQAMARHTLGQREESDAALAELVQNYEQDTAYNIAYVLAYRDEADRAFEWLDKALAYRDPGLSSIGKDPLFANIHADPRWALFLAKIGMSPEQLDVIEFEVTLPK